jgi:hypothetical protein
MARHVAVLLLFLALVAGCARHGEAPASAAAAAPGEAPSAVSEANRFLAYEHTVAIETDAEKIAPLFDAVQAACRAAVEESCAILQASVSSGDEPFANLRFRAKAEGIRKLIAVLSSQGEVAGKSTSAEDLAGPISDTAKQLAMLTDYRDKLEVLRNRGSSDIDVLMKLTRELAEVQSQIEDLSGSQARLMQRVNTEILNVTIRSFESVSFWQPIASSASDFGEDFSFAIATALTALAYLIPWGLVLLLIFLGVRKVVRWRKKSA